MDPAHVLPPPGFGGRNSRNRGESMSRCRACTVISRLGKDEDWRVGGTVSPLPCHLWQVAKLPGEQSSHPRLAALPEPPSPCWWRGWWQPAVMTVPSRPPAPGSEDTAPRFLLNVGCSG